VYCYSSWTIVSVSKKQLSERHADFRTIFASRFSDLQGRKKKTITVYATIPTFSCLFFPVHVSVYHKTVTFRRYNWTVCRKHVQVLKYFTQYTLLQINSYKLKCYLHRIMFPNSYIEGSLSQFTLFYFILFINYWLKAAADVLLQVGMSHVYESFTVPGGMWSTCHAWTTVWRHRSTHGVYRSSGSRVITMNNNEQCIEWPEYCVTGSIHSAYRKALV
jgi:hypothetical protein